MATTFSGVIRLRRDNDFNYAKVANTFIPASGEVCLVDTSKGLKAKVGDGIKTFAQLDYTDKALEDSMRDLIVKGYYYEEKFYKDELHTEPIEGYAYKLFINVPENKIYTYIDEKFSPVENFASATKAGVMRLYDESGTNVDGTMTQRAITLADTGLSNRINEKISARAESSTETLFLIFN